MRNSPLRKKAKSQDIVIQSTGENPHDKHAVIGRLSPVNVSKKDRTLYANVDTS
jgi:hypothetical protein